MSTMKMYKEAVLDHYRNPRNYGELPSPDVFVREDNPLCGDEVALSMSFDVDRQLDAVRFTGRGCALAMATASMLTVKIQGKPLHELRTIDEAQLLEMLGIEVLPMRMKCVRLSLDVLRRALAMYETGAGKPAAAADPAAREVRRAHSLFDHIGNTPLLRLDAAAWGLPPGVQLYAKHEAMNPGGTIKARSVLGMIRNGIKANQLPLLPGMTIMDVMSGSSGIALAMIGAQMGFGVKLICPATITEDAKRVLRAYGAQLQVLIDPKITAAAAAGIARESYRKDPGRMYYLDMFHNPAAWSAHYATTGPEILAQCGEPITHFVAGIGTGATITGVARRLKEHDKAIQVFGVVPGSAAEHIDGLRHPSATPSGGASGEVSGEA